MKIPLIVVVALGLVGRVGAVPPQPAIGEQLRWYWQQDRRAGLLLVVLPPNADQETKDEKSGAAPTTLTEWLSKNEKTATRFGTVTAIGDLWQDAANDRLGAPDYTATGNPWSDTNNALPVFLGSLTKSQWRKIASPSGLGWSDLEGGEQKTLWEVVVPNPFVFDRTTTQYKRRETPPDKLRQLNDDERHQVRLRVKLMTSVLAKMSSGTGRMPVIIHKNRGNQGGNGESFLDLKGHGEPYAPPGVKSETSTTLLGQVIATRQRNVLAPIPEEIDPASFATPISLLPTLGEQRLTIGNVLDRIKAVTGRAVLCHPELAKYAAVPVGGNTSVPAWDVLRAVLFGTNTALRVLPPAVPDDQPILVLAPSAEPLGQRQGRINDWYLGAQLGGRARNTKAYETIAELGAADLLQFDGDDPLPLSGDLRHRVFEAARRPAIGTIDGRSGGIDLSLTDLPTSSQQVINDAAKRLADISATTDSDGAKYDFRVRVTTVNVGCSPWLSYIAPGSGDLAGEIDGDPLPGLSEWLPHKDADSAAVMPAGRVVLLAPVDSADAAEKTRAAVAGNASELWLETTPEIVAAAVNEAGGRLPIRAVVSLLRADADTPPSLPRDENIYGKTSRDWLVPDDPAVIRRAQERVQALARVPGIAGIVLRDIAAPGYRTTGQPASPVQISGSGDVGYMFGGSGRLLGYTLKHRRAFAQDNGYDPADVAFRADRWEFPEKKFFESAAATKAYAAWYVARVQPLWETVRNEMSGLSVLVEGEAAFRSQDWINREGSAYFLPWNTQKDPIPPLLELFRSANSSTPPVPNAAYVYATVVGNRENRLVPEDLLVRLKREDKPQTTVLDLTDRTRPGVVKILRKLRSMK